MNENCPAYVKKESITPTEAAKLIREANGKVILAHPVAYTYEDNLTDEEIINIIKEINADGIESNYIYIDRNNNKINDIEKWNNYAKKLNLITTIGSDFHNFDNIHPTVGLINENINLSLNEINNILYNLNN
jgi:predicted metal-dependent phosphoesterase TrpH